MSSSFFLATLTLFDFSMSSTIFIIGLRLKSSRSSHPFTKKKISSFTTSTSTSGNSNTIPATGIVERKEKPNDPVIHDKSVSFQVGVRFATEEMKRR